MKKILVFLLIAVLLTVTVTGCGLLKKASNFKDDLDDIGDFVDNLEDQYGDDIDDGDDDDYDDGDDDYDDPDTGDDGDAEEYVYSGTVFYPGLFSDVFDRFQEFGYVWTSVDAEGNSNQWSVYYVSEGTEDVDGIEAEVMSATYTEGETTEYKFWFDEGWECIKATVNGEEDNDWGATALTMPIATYVNYVTLTQVVVGEDGILDTFSYKLEDQRSESSDVGGMEVYEISSIFSNITITYGLVDIDGESIYTLIRQEARDSSVLEECLVTHAVPR